VRAAGLLAMMGVFDIVGTTISGWLSDRFSSRYLLFIYYALRGLSLLALPYTLLQGHSELKWFAVFYGLDWVATVPPTVRLTADLFGRQNAGVIFGWVAAAHQLGAALAAMGSGAIRTSYGDYRPAFLISGMVCFLAGLSFLFTRRLLDRPGPHAGASSLAPAMARATQ
jgi:predicted MFS family arabinose efflux permease